MRKLFIFFTIIFLLASCTEKEPKQIRLMSVDGLYFMSMSVNGKKGNFLVDTGASVSIIDINQSEDYGFNYIELPINITTIGIGGTEKTYRIQDLALAYDTTRIYTEFRGVDIHNIVSAFKKRGVSIIGVIGSNYFNETNAVIRYKHHTIEIYPAD